MINVPLTSLNVSIPTTVINLPSFTFTTTTGITVIIPSINWPTPESLPRLNVPKLPNFTPPTFVPPSINVQLPSIINMKMAVAAIVKSEIYSIIQAAKIANGIEFTLSEVVPENISLSVSITSPVIISQ